MSDFGHAHKDNIKKWIVKSSGRVNPAIASAFMTVFLPIYRFHLGDAKIVPEKLSLKFNQVRKWAKSGYCDGVVGCSLQRLCSINLFV